MKKEIINVVKKVIILAKRRNANMSRITNEELDDLIKSGYSSGKELRYYLEGLDFNREIKYLQALMYLGRDRQYGELPPEQRLEACKRDMDNDGWNDKDIEISIILGKSPLDEYLESGLKWCAFI